MNKILYLLCLVVMIYCVETNNINGLILNGFALMAISLDEINDTLKKQVKTLKQLL